MIALQPEPFVYGTGVIVHQDLFSTEGFGGGIHHRAEQIGEILGRAGPPVVRPDIDPSGVGKAAGLLSGLRHLRLRGYRAPQRLPFVGRYGRRLVAMARFFASLPPNSCVVWALPADFIVPHAARLCGLPLVAVPMTFESLIPWGHDVLGGGGPWDKLRFEVEHIGMASSVFCISEAEQWLLAGFGIKADYLPSYPAESLLRHLEVLRARRIQSSKNHVLILSSNNPANRAGNLQLIKLLTSLHGQRMPPVIIAGRGTEQMTGTVPEGVTCEGTVSQSRLDELIVSTRVILIYQTFGTGALTRIPEVLVAGVPVICNGVAARSARHYVGVHTYETADELARLLRADLPSPPVPPRPVGAEERFLQAVCRTMAPSGRAAGSHTGAVK